MGTATRQPAFATLPRAAAGFKSSVPIRARYDNWIAGEYVAPASDRPRVAVGAAGRIS